MDLLIMYKDTIAGKWIDNKLTAVNSALLPIYLQRTGNVEMWLEMRAIDYHRANSRLLKKALRLAERDDINTVISVNAVTITDNFWVRPADSDLTYDDVKFRNDYFATLALRGTYDRFNRLANSRHTRTPELTNTGSFEKCWRLIDGQWWMYKKANHEELFSELFIYKLGKKLGFNMAEYKRGRGIIKTKDFTNSGAVNFEAAYSFMGDNENYIDTIKAIKNLDTDKTTKAEIIEDYVKMLFLDTICANPDRHTFNFGLLTDGDTNKIISLAPNFDNNMALISKGYPKNISRKNDILVKLFNELLEYDGSLKKYVPHIDETIISEILSDLNMRVKTQTIIDFIMNGYNQIQH